ncbi:unnamed protein product [Zymoseptoria tritici ST99CH_3D1]|uniref:J domain-containing protein n=3 Tax=Zymoseptoria tritici TaxID=1047171 RepID=F9XNU4_ZYMTI|nr:uncharacterized protein MYCGRDRAFT_106357 [Zymoseptoria tritici IPO323]EGP83107.1 hypothetical protein MYCGRDRAFT_106357 [Zymoseptoria tritici IPO323]SMQ55779.1 unnamed protein product [Zymoseptoria tritici ST99CH_3D7]SMR60967.1 unnamed protein product [Zymoseptoria tritici ST99CH_1E4]SMR64112.1 unnamed protein product [Zymoseptoria tritici ST99CH_3D1]
MIVRSCFHKRTIPPSISFLNNALSTRPFHSSIRRQDEGGNHYNTLDLPTNATPKEIKKQFYKLSKSHHPDLHPNDPSASQKFVKISEAYATLGSPEKRQRYDRDHIQTSSAPSSSASSPRGSYSSASSSSGPGGRPASGLSRRRTAFRGPPPSFYRSGGWGEHSDKRSEHSQKSSHSHEAQGQAASGPRGPSAGGASAEPGMGPGGFAAGFEGRDVPHFDGRAHTATHEEIEKRQRVRRRRTVQAESAEMAGNGSSVLFNFVVLMGILGVVVGTSGAVYGGKERRERKATVEAAASKGK